MPIKNYGVLKCQAVQTIRGSNEFPHYQIRATAKGEDHRIAINVKSEQKPSELLYIIVDDFHHPMTDALTDLPDGFTALDGKRTLSLDYIRSNLFQREDLTPLPHHAPGENSDLNEKLDQLVAKSVDGEAVLYVFGDRSAAQAEQKDKFFDFTPTQGIHDVHMNQGNTVDDFKEDNGVYQDGGLLIHYPAENRWSAVFLAYQHQAWHTDDKTGAALDVDLQDRAPEVSKDEVESPVLIVGATVTGPEESVTLLNVTNQTIHLIGWSLANQAKDKYSLTGRIAPGEFLNVKLENRTEFFKNTGDIITLLDQNGLKVDGEAYTREQVKAGQNIAFV